MRNKKFSSIGNDLTEDVFEGKTFKTKRKINKIAVHCAATPNNKTFDAFDIDRWHKQRWGKTSGIGYHYVILLDGTIQKGRWVDSPGAHVKGHNSDSIGVCYIGGLDKNGHVAQDKLTSAQLKSLVTLLRLLKDLYDLDTNDILGHNEFPYVNKACPCLNMDNIRQLVQH